MRLPINQSEIEYDKLNDILNLKGPGHKLRLTDASSGFQSFVPLYLVSGVPGPHGAGAKPTQPTAHECR